MLSEVFASDSHQYHSVLHEMLRRGQVSVAVAAKALSSCDIEPYSAEQLHVTIARLHLDPAVAQCIETVIDRTLDFVHAAIAERSLLGELSNIIINNITIVILFISSIMLFL